MESLTLALFYRRKKIEAQVTHLENGGTGMRAEF